MPAQSFRNVLVEDSGRRNDIGHSIVASGAGALVAESVGGLMTGAAELAAVATLCRVLVLAAAVIHRRSRRLFVSGDVKASWPSLGSFAPAE